MAESCGTCTYWVGETFCCRYPPTSPTVFTQQWPVTVATDWCGEWKAGTSDYPGMTVTPNTAPSTASTLVTIEDVNGGLMSTTAVDIGGPCTGVSVLSDTQVTCRTPAPGTPSTVQVLISRATGGDVTGPDFVYT